jgi:hypothetical protein
MKMTFLLCRREVWKGQGNKHWAGASDRGCRSLYEPASSSSPIRNIFMADHSRRSTQRAADRSGSASPFELTRPSTCHDGDDTAGRD